MEDASGGNARFQGVLSESEPRVFSFQMLGRPHNLDVSTASLLPHQELVREEGPGEIPKMVCYRRANGAVYTFPAPASEGLSQ